MIKVTLKSGKEMPMLGLGTYQLAGEQCVIAVKKALRIGYRLIDTAEFYNNEKEIGIAIKETNRESLFITSKVWFGNLRYADVIKACNNSLSRLGTEYIDLYLIHWPNKSIKMKETFDAMNKLYDEGKIKSIGVSNFTVRHLKDAMLATKIPISINQVEFHPWLYQKELLSFARKHGIFITAYAPIARSKFFGDETINWLAEKYHKTCAQVCLRWLIQKEVIAIPKAASEEHLIENFDISDFSIEEKDMKMLDGLPQSRLVSPEIAEFD